VKNTPINGKEPWPLGNAALKKLGQDIASSDLCRAVLKENVDLAALSDDGFEFLERIGLL